MGGVIFMEGNLDWKFFEFWVFIIMIGGMICMQFFVDGFVLMSGFFEFVMVF